MASTGNREQETARTQAAQQGGTGTQQKERHDDEGDDKRSNRVPTGGLNEEIGDMDAEADPDQDADHEDGLPGKAGGGLMGG
jgi:hypothetical protein